MAIAYLKFAEKDDSSMKKTENVTIVSQVAPTVILKLKMAA